MTMAEGQMYSLAESAVATIGSAIRDKRDVKAAQFVMKQLIDLNRAKKRDERRRGRGCDILWWMSNERPPQGDIPFRNISRSKRPAISGTNIAMARSLRWRAALKHIIFIKNNLIRSLGNRLEKSPCRVYDADMRLRAARYSSTRFSGCFCDLW